MIAFSIFLPFFLIVSVFNLASANYNISLVPQSMPKFPADEFRELEVIVFSPESCETHLQLHPFIKFQTPSDSIGLDLSPKNFSCNISHSSRSVHKRTIRVNGLFLGKSGLAFDVYRSDNQHLVAQVTDYRINVVRPERVIDILFNVLLPILVLINTVVYGCKIDLSVVREILKRPLAPCVGLACQFFLLPLTAYALCFLMKLEGHLAIGLFALGCSPAGGASNVWTILLDGDLNLSVTMTFIGTICSLAVMPAWLFSLGRTLLDSGVSIPFTNILASLAVLVIGCGAGVLLRFKRPEFAAKVARLVKFFAVCFLIFILTLGVTANLYMFRLMSDWRILVSGMIMPWGSLAFALLIPLVFKLGWRRAKTIAIEVSIQNTGIPIILLRNSLPQPDADLSSVMPVASAIFTPAPLWIGFVALVVYKRWFAKPETCAKEQNNDKEPLPVEKDAALPATDNCPFLEQVSKCAVNDDSVSPEKPDAKILNEKNQNCAV